MFRKLNKTYLLSLQAWGLGGFPVVLLFNSGIWSWYSLLAEVKNILVPSHWVLIILLKDQISNIADEIPTVKGMAKSFHSPQHGHCKHKAVQNPDFSLLSLENSE